MIKIAPSILSADFGNLAEAIKEAEQGGADLIHIDVMDGQFVSNITIGPVVIKGIRSITKLPFDVHLMISNPEKYIPDFIKAGSDIITVHTEATNHLHGAIQLIKKQKVRAGVALNPSTPIGVVENIMEDVDMIVVMTVNPGFGGQGFIKTMLPKINEARKIIERSGHDIDLEVDGGINPENSKLVVDAGANILVAGSAVFRGAGSIGDNIAKLKGST
ncbi:MAG: ribulose-phosphate 3-epimerase [Methanomassiliicoccales archaeon]|nr:MAG: ribulose-phosphate 3-epimerase [Methanomassiliicoccales archaeon]